MDYTEIMNICGYDLEKSHKMVEKYPQWMKNATQEALKEVGLESLSAKSNENQHG